MVSTGTGLEKWRKQSAGHFSHCFPYSVSHWWIEWDLCARHGSVTIDYVRRLFTCCSTLNIIILIKHRQLELAHLSFRSVRDTKRLRNECRLESSGTFFGWVLRMFVCCVRRSPMASVKMSTSRSAKLLPIKINARLAVSATCKQSSDIDLSLKSTDKRTACRQTSRESADWFQMMD